MKTSTYSVRSHTDSIREEVARDDPARLSAEELRPSGAEASGRRTEAGAAEEHADRGRAHANPQLPQLA